MDLGIVLFVILTTGLAYVSRTALRVPLSHGFYRFFAWEALLALFLLNVPRWFDRPFSPRQIASWILLLASLYLVIAGLALLRRWGRPGAGREDPRLAAIERTTTLVKEGIYGNIRHPLYSSLICLGWGIFLKQPDWRAGVLALATSVLLWLTARVEEVENVRYFGQAYKDYMEETKMFLPFVL